jgi:hypothetical protein
VITISAVNDAPIFTKGANQTVLEDAGAQTVTAWATGITAGAADESSQAIDFIVTNSNNALFSVQPAIAANGTLTFTPAANVNGSATVTVQLHDNGGTLNGGADTSAAQSFTITVTSVNDAPSFTKGADRRDPQDGGARTVTGWATAISAGPADESTQALNFIVTNSNNALFSVQPAISANGTLTYTLAAGASGTATVTVTLHDDGGVANGGVDTSAAQTFVINVIAKPTITINDVSVIEGNSGYTPANFPVTLSWAFPAPVTVNYLSGNGTARSPADYLSASGTLTFAAEEVSKVITVQVVGETTKEKDETFGINLSSPTNATIARGSATGIILDDDATPRVTVSSTSGTSSPSSGGAAGPQAVDKPVVFASIVEGNAGQKQAVFAVTLSNMSSDVITVDYSTVAGLNARANIDFLPVTGTLVFPAESPDPQYIVVPIVGDKRREPNQKFSVHLANPIFAVIDTSDAGVDIVDDDPDPAISVADVPIAEAVDTTVNAVVMVTMTNDSDFPITVDYKTTDGTALAGLDYGAVSGTLTFQPGEMSQAITIPIYSDKATEGAETFYVDITNPTGGATIAQSHAVVTISDPWAWVSDTVADFNAGTVGTGAYLADTSNGEISLAPTVATEFTGGLLPTGWTSTMLAIGGTSVVGNGSLAVNGTSVLSPISYTAGHTLEFVATFSGTPNQNAGFGLTTALLPPFAMFGTKADGLLYARSLAPGITLETAIPGSWFGAPHRFRIDWTSTGVVYWIDGVQKVSHAIVYSGKTNTMRPAITDQTVDGGAIKVDWMRMSAYALTGTYTSPVYNAGASVMWQSAAWAADIPAGTAITVEVRTGTTPDVTTWGPFQTVANSGDALTVPAGQYAQYRLTLTRVTTPAGSATPVTASDTLTPVVKSIVLSFLK